MGERKTQHKERDNCASLRSVFGYGFVAMRSVFGFAMGERKTQHRERQVVLEGEREDRGEGCDIRQLSGGG